MERPAELRFVAYLSPGTVAGIPVAARRARLPWKNPGLRFLALFDP